MKFSKLVITLLITLYALQISASRKEAYNGLRIFWDPYSKCTIFEPGNYARMIQLQDGRLLATAEQSGIAISFSDDLGKNWSTPVKIASAPSGYFLAVPDIVQLNDGTIIIGYNPRPTKPYSTERKFGIRCRRSTDNGATWSDEIFIFDAQHTFNDGCWEPSFLELPDGELQCYFANENDYTSSNEQCISMCRSFDKGLTWESPVKVSFRANSRDGMPVPILLKDQSEIVVGIEDNGWPGRGNFAMTTVRTTLADNWKSGYVDANSSKRNMIFETIPEVGIVSAAPYLRVLPSGETVASYQGSEGRISSDIQYLDMFVETGNKNARNFKARTRPFALGNDLHAMWNSVAVIDTGIVVALGSIGEPNKHNHIEMIKGYPKRVIEANFSTPAIDGAISSTDQYTYKNARQIFIGHENGKKCNVDFAFDNNYLYFCARVVDSDIYTDKVDDDGVTLSLDMLNVCDVYPQTGMYKFFFDANGTFTFKEGEPYGTNGGGKWYDVTDTDGIIYKNTIKSFYYDVEVAIPWSKIGCISAPVNNAMRIDISIRDRSESSIAEYSIVDTETTSSKPNSWAWMEFRLNGTSGISKIDTNDLNTYISGDSLQISSNINITTASLFGIDGRLINKQDGLSREYSFLIKNNFTGLIVIVFEDGTTKVKKIIK